MPLNLIYVADMDGADTAYYEIMQMDEKPSTIIKVGSWFKGRKL